MLGPVCGWGVGKGVRQHSTESESGFESLIKPVTVVGLKNCTVYSE